MCLSEMLTIRSVHARVSQIYYTYGLFCASHPIATIICVIVTVCITCYPLVNLPLPGNTPIEHRTSKDDHAVPDSLHGSSTDGIVDEQKRPRWFVGEPVAYVQQIVVKSAVSPWWPQHLLVSDAFRAPIASVFKIIQELENFKVRDGNKEISLGDICYRVSEPVNARQLQELLPDYSCFIVSPANFWRQDINKYNKDADVIKTVYKKYGQVVETIPSVKDLLFGVPWQQTGVTRYYIRNRQRVITYAVTIIMKKYDPKFISALAENLEEHHPSTTQNVNNSEIEDLVHVHFKDVNYFVEYTPLLVTYFVLLLYLYFSVRKIDMVKSKIGLAISAVMTVLASLLMSVSICTLFGMTPTLNGGEIFPYLVVIVGVENVLVITKSVVSTPVHLDVKIRVAQGLSREGWFITKNLLTELAIVFVGFFTFVPAIQEFCAFALVGVLSDFYLQIAFFATVLSVDIRRMELSDLHRQSVQQAVQEDNSTMVNIEPLVLCPVASRSPRSSVSRQHSSPTPEPPGQRSPQPSPTRHGSADQVFFGQPPSERPKYEMPRRVKFFYFLARFRIVQKLIMVCTVIWIVLILYKAGLVDKLTGEDDIHTVPQKPFGMPKQPQWPPQPDLSKHEEETAIANTAQRGEEEPEIGPVEHTDLELWRKLSHQHWPTLFRCYNISLSGRFISILPTLHLSELIDPQVAIEMRHPTDKASDTSKLSFTRPVSYPEDAHSGEKDPQETSDTSHYHPQLDNFYPRSQKEFVITVCLCILSVIIISYFMVVLYRCMCSRNYSRWRHSWARSGRKRVKGYYKQIKESVPLNLAGHTQTIECLVGDNGLIISCCLGGHLKIWDSNTGHCINTIKRNSATPPSIRRPCVGRNIEDSDADLYEEYHEKIGRSSSETSLGEGRGGGDGVRIRKGNFSMADTNVGRGKRMGRSRNTNDRFQDIMPDLTTTINTEFSTMDSRAQVPSQASGYDFRSWFEGLYEEHRKVLEEEENEPSRCSRIHSASDLTSLLPPEERIRSMSQGDHPGLDISGGDEDILPEQASSVWCLASMHGLIVTGCGNGRIEVWEAETGELRYHYGIKEVGVTGLCVVANKIVAARLDGTVDFLEMETFQNPAISPRPGVPPVSRANMGHTRSSSRDRIEVWNETIRCADVFTCRAHQMPINAIQCAGGRIVTASQDHTLKVFRLDNCLCLYTLHGHEGSVTALCLDQVTPFAAVSGSIDGTVRIWDLLTGTCVHKFCWHESTVVTITTSPLYIVTVGLDDRMCIWERTKCVLLHTINLDQDGVGSAAQLSRNLIVTGGQGNLSLWDIPRGSLLRKVVFSDSEQRAFVNHVVSVSNNGIVCDQGRDLKVVFFPTILEKAE